MGGASPTGASRPPEAGPRDVAVLALFDIRTSGRPWSWSRFVFAAPVLRRVPGLRFFKVLGSGHEGGFGLKPSPSIQGLFCVFDDPHRADAFADADDGPLAPWRARSREAFSVKLRAFSSRGTWSGHAIGTSAGPPSDGPVASLTRASIRPSRARAFWAMEPPAERDLQRADGCRIAAGVGELPLVRQATFTIWDDAAAMDGYARTGGHLAAIRAARAGDFFSESMFVRFVPYDARGTWRGRTVG